jgi:hypothetical protein
MRSAISLSFLTRILHKRCLEMRLVPTLKFVSKLCIVISIQIWVVMKKIERAVSEAWLSKPVSLLLHIIFENDTFSKIFLMN